MTDVTQLLLKWNSGDSASQAELMEALHSELRRIAAGHLASDRNAELQPSALVNEAYLRIVALNRIKWQNRAHFLAMSAKIMRDVLVDEARKRNAVKRSGGIQVTLSGLAADNDSPSTDALVLHEALEQLAKIDADRARLVELRFYGGLTLEETAEVMGTSVATVKRSWQVIRAWLYKELNQDDSDD